MLPPRAYSLQKPQIPAASWLSPSAREKLADYSVVYIDERDAQSVSQAKGLIAYRRRISFRR